MSRRQAHDQGYEDERTGRVDNSRYSNDYNYKSGVMERWHEERAAAKAKADAAWERSYDGASDRLPSRSRDSSSQSAGSTVDGSSAGASIRDAILSCAGILIALVILAFLVLAFYTAIGWSAEGGWPW